MTWEELKEKAKKMGGFICNASSIEQEKILYEDFVFYKNGTVRLDDTDEDGFCTVVHTIKSGCSYDKMLMIMKGLE